MTRLRAHVVFTFVLVQAAWGLETPPEPTTAYGVYVSEQDVTILEGESRIITCTAVGYPLPTVQWQKVDGEFRDGVRQVGNNLLIPYAEETDQGIYVCRGIVEGIVVAYDYSVLKVQDDSTDPTPVPEEGLTVTVSERSVEIPVGESRIITCTPEGNPLPVVKWEKADGKFREGVRQDGNNLLIPYAQEEDQGIYECSGTVEGIEVAYDYSVVKVVESPLEPTTSAPAGSPRVTVSDRQVQITEGESKTITCTPEGSPLPKVQWLKANGEFREGVWQDGNTLVIYDAQKEDTAHYVCRGIVEGTTVWSDYSAVDVVEEPALTTPEPWGHPKVTIIEPEVQIPVGESKTLTCTPQGSPLPRVKWAKADGEFRDGVRQEGNTLVITEARKEDEANYVCRGIIEGTTVWTDYARVEVVDEPAPITPEPWGHPKVTIIEREVQIPEGESKTLTCTPQGSPLPRVKWAKANGEFRDGVRQEGNTLVITEARKEDEANYVCRGIIEGTTVWTDYARVEVVDSQPKVTITERAVTIPRGESKTITCTPQGSPLPTVEWTKWNDVFRYGVRQDGNTLIIPSAREENEGIYVCRGIVDGKIVWNDHTTVEIVEPTPKPNQYTVTVSDREVELQVGERRTIICTPKGSPLPRVQWLKADGDELGDGVVQYNNILYIYNARKENQAHYVCRGIVDGTVFGEDFSKVTVV